MFLCYKILIGTFVFYRNFLLGSGAVCDHLPSILMTAIKLEPVTDDTLVSVDTAGNKLLGSTKGQGIIIHRTFRK